MRSSSHFDFVDLFAGIGGFHAAIGTLGGRGVYASEIDTMAADVYELNWRVRPEGDIVPATTNRMDVPEHDVLAAGFPCQPFSKSGYQRGMEEARGTLFWNILRVLKTRRPTVVLLENVRNLTGPRHAQEWDVIVRSLRELGYRVSSTPAVFSPHLLPPELGGRPQIRERVFILGTYVGKRKAEEDVAPIVRNRAITGWNPQEWDLETHLPLDPEHTIKNRDRYALSSDEQDWIEAWDDFVRSIRAAGMLRPPGFPIWRDAFVHEGDLVIDEGTPYWKADFLEKNARLYTNFQVVIDEWLDRWDGLNHFPPSRRKFEWQAQDAKSVWETVMHLRPSGVRVKRPTYLPALVAITQTSIIGQHRRRITPIEAARLQGLPEWFNFGDQPDAATYKQLGNGVSVGAAYHVLREHVLRDLEVIRKRSPGLAIAAEHAPVSPDQLLESRWAPSKVGTRTRWGLQPEIDLTSAG